MLDLISIMAIVAAVVIAVVGWVWVNVRVVRCGVACRRIVGFSVGRWAVMDYKHGTECAKADDAVEQAKQRLMAHFEHMFHERFLRDPGGEVSADHDARFLRRAGLRWADDKPRPGGDS